MFFMLSIRTNFTLDEKTIHEVSTCGCLVCSLQQVSWPSIKEVLFSNIFFFLLACVKQSVPTGFHAVFWLEYYLRTSCFLLNLYWFFTNTLKANPLTCCMKPSALPNTFALSIRKALSLYAFLILFFLSINSKNVYSISSCASKKMMHSVFFRWHSVNMSIWPSKLFFMNNS